MYQQLNLKNSGRLLLIPYQDTKAATVYCMFPVGSRYEHKKIVGVSHFIEHLMFKGTKKRPTTLDISRELDAHGAEYNAFTSKDYTGYYIKIDAEQMPLALDILSDMLFHSKFEGEEIDKERGVIIEELHMYEDNPTMHIDTLFEETLYGDHPLGWRIGGWPEQIKAVTREEIISYRDKFYDPAKMVVAVAGKLPADALAQIEKTFGAVGGGKTAVVKPESWKELGAERIFIQYKETDQTHIALGMPALSYEHKDLPALKLLTVILGGTMSSRLFIEVREKRGLAYSVRAGVESYHETGNFSVRAGLDKNRLEQALTVIMNELKKVKESGVTKKEFTDAKTNFHGRLVLELEESNALADFYSRQALLMEKIKTPEEKLAEIDAVTIEDVHRVAGEILDFKKLRMAVIGGVKDAKPLEKILF
ncbi:MAG: Peptidase M16 domain protein [Candidatus Magasanikbacteria bacterium]|nr:Peptidase M16 domain protein [Candidatus Magasanikbacteria bacterium]